MASDLVSDALGVIPCGGGVVLSTLNPNLSTLFSQLSALISAEEVARVYFFFYIVQAGVVAVGDDGL
jgi:hypothetical protein